MLANHKQPVSEQARRGIATLKYRVSSSLMFCPLEFNVKCCLLALIIITNGHTERYFSILSRWHHLVLHNK